MRAGLPAATCRPLTLPAMHRLPDSQVRQTLALLLCFQYTWSLLVPASWPPLRGSQDLTAPSRNLPTKKQQADGNVRATLGSRRLLLSTEGPSRRIRTHQRYNPALKYGGLPSNGSLSLSPQCFPLRGPPGMRDLAALTLILALECFTALAARA